MHRSTFRIRALHTHTHTRWIHKSSRCTNAKFSYGVCATIIEITLNAIRLICAYTAHDPSLTFFFLEKGSCCVVVFSFKIDRVFPTIKHSIHRAGICWCIARISYPLSLEWRNHKIKKTWPSSRWRVSNTGWPCYISVYTPFNFDKRASLYSLVLNHSM